MGGTKQLFTINPTIGYLLAIENGLTIIRNGYERLVGDFIGPG